MSPMSAVFKLSIESYICIANLISAEARFKLSVIPKQESAYIKV
jgi:hypothetical protein